MPKPSDGQKTITEIASTYGLSLRTLRFYEQQGLLRPTRLGYQRLYSKADEIRIELIIKGKRLGFTILEIKALIAENRQVEKTERPLVLPMSKSELEERIQALEWKRAELMDAIEDLRAAHARLSPAQSALAAAQNDAS